MELLPAQEIYQFPNSKQSNFKTAPRVSLASQLFLEDKYKGNFRTAPRVSSVPYDGASFHEYRYKGNSVTAPRVSLASQLFLDARNEYKNKGNF